MRMVISNKICIKEKQSINHFCTIIHWWRPHFTSKHLPFTKGVQSNGEKKRKRKKKTKGNKEKLKKLEI